MAFRNDGRYSFVANDDMGGGDFGGGDSLQTEGGDLSGGGGGGDNSGGSVSGGAEISGGTGDIPTIGAIMDRAAASSSADALPGFTTKSADVVDDSTDKPNPNDFPVDKPIGTDTVNDTGVVDSSTNTTNPNDFPPNTDDVPEMTIVDKKDAKTDVPEMVITGNRPGVPTENIRSIDTTDGTEDDVVTPTLTPVTPTIPTTPTGGTATTSVTTPVTTPVTPTPPPVVTPPPTSGPAEGETEEQWRLRMGLTGAGNLTDFDKEIARLKGGMDTGVATSKGLISANMKPPGG